MRRTKIIATLGPAVDAPNVLRQMLLQLDLVRINMSHGLQSDHKRRIELVRAISQEYQRHVGIMIDLQGPKIRIAKFKQGEIVLKASQKFILDANLDSDSGDENQVGIDYKNLPNDLQANDILLLDDGRLVFKVLQIENAQIVCQVIQGGKLSNNKGINRQGGGLSAKALTDKDRLDIKFAAEMQADYVAISFPIKGQDIEEAKSLLVAAGSTAGVIAKIERIEAVAAIDEIINAAEGVMVARGDLGVEIGFAQLPLVQKQIIARARSLNKAVITATQMMESMISNSIPTRAEVSDVANAVLDGTDAVMLSGETASGNYPVEVVETMAGICLAAETQKSSQISKHRLECHFSRDDEAIAMATMYTANHCDVKAIIAITESGSTPLWMSRIRSGIAIFGLSHSLQSIGRMTLYRGVYPKLFIEAEQNELAIDAAIKLLVNLGHLQNKDRIIISFKHQSGEEPGANTMKLVKV